MKRWKALALCSALAVGMCGCSTAGAYGRELEETVLVQILGIDAGGSGITLTAAGAGGDGETVVETVSGSDLADAFKRLPTVGEQYLSLTNVTHVIVGDGVNLKQVLDYVLADKDMSYSAGVWTVSGFAGPLVKMVGEEDGIGRFTVLKQSGEDRPTVKTALAGLENEGETALPALAVREGTLDVVGTLYFEVRE